MGLFSFFWDVRQDSDIKALQSTADSSALFLQSAQHQLRELRGAVDRLALVNQALWELLRERAELTDADLERKIDEVDRRDGNADGRMAQPVQACPRCRKPNAQGRARCLYCGTTMRSASDAR